MKTVIYKIDENKCKDYLVDIYSGWANFTTKIVSSSLIGKGKFYCFAPEDINNTAIDIDNRDLYAFTQAKGMSMSTPYPEDVIVNFLYSCLNAQYLKSPKLIAEDYSYEPNSPYMVDFVKMGGKYFLVNNVIFYMSESGSDNDDIKNIINIAKAYGCFPFLTNTEVGPFEPYKNIDLESEQRILENVCMFFTPIYDSESYLFWIKDGNDKLLDLMEVCMKNV